MLDFTTIENTLNRLDREYNASITDSQLTLFYAKLSVIEFCGWIEDSIDELLHDYINAHILEAQNKTLIKKHIKKNNSFSYEDKIFPLISSVLGINIWENILDTFPSADFAHFTSILTSYSPARNEVAHTYTKRMTPHYLAPSRVLGDYTNFKPAMQYLEREISHL